MNIDVAQVYSDYQGKVMGYLRARISSRAEAEDLCSEVFEKVLRKIDGYDDSKASLSTWIFSITRNTLIDHFRRTRPQAELDENLAEEGELEDGLLENETLGELAAALKRLPEQLRDIIVLRYYDGKPLTEIAKMMDLSYGAVKLRHQNALMLLKEKMA